MAIQATRSLLGLGLSSDAPFVGHIRRSDKHVDLLAEKIEQ